MLDFDYGYSERAKLFIAEAKRRQAEYDGKKKRRMLWLGKFAFPQVNTKKTKILFVPPDYRRYYLPIMEPLTAREYRTDTHTEPKRAEIELNKWGYIGKHWLAVVRFGYYEKDDILIVCPDTFKYQRVLPGINWWDV